MIHVALFGPPASGKGTQAERLSRRHSLFHLSTGRLLRQNISWGTPLGREAASNIAQGRLVPDQVVDALVAESLAQFPEGMRGVLFDGYPRSVPQLTAIDALLAEHDHRLDLGLELRLPEMEVITRASSRRECEDCRTVFNLQLIPEGNRDVCPSCGSTGLVRRGDDDPEVVRERLLSYERDTIPVLRRLRESGRLQVIDGLGSAGEVEARLNALIEPLLAERSPS